KEESQPYLLSFTKDARERWVRFYNEWAKRQAESEGEIAASLSKLEGFAARFALLHHVVTLVHLEVDDRREVGVRSVEAGITLCRWFADEAARIYAMLAETEQERNERRLVEYIEGRGGSVTARDLQRANKKKYPTAEDADAALNGLVEAGI